MRFMYKSCDLVISAPKKAEGFGRTISEALAMEKIVLCYNFGGSMEQICDLNQLYAVKPQDKNQMIEKINLSLYLPDAKKIEMGKIGRKHIEQNFSNSNMLKNYLSFYKEIIT